LSGALLLIAALGVSLNVAARAVGQQTFGAKPPQKTQPAHGPQSPGQPATPAPLPGPGTSGTSSSAAPAAVAGMVGVFFAFYFVIIAFAIVFSIGGVILSCLAIYDCARRDFPDPGTRAVWCLLIALLRLIGAIVYYFVIYRKDDPPIQQRQTAGAPPPSPMSG
jgi:hypothetical protein